LRFIIPSEDLLSVCIPFILLLQSPPDTQLVIQNMLRKTPIAPAGGPDALMGLAPSILNPSLSETSIASRIHAEVGRYRMRLAQSPEDRIAACRLRFRVFNIEMGEGLDSSYETGLDTDQFDDVCEHLLVEDKQADNPARCIVGTYRMQTGATAARYRGYYSEQEFHLSPYEPLRPGVLELGRASIDREHRTPEVLTLLWRGIAQYATDMGLRYLIGCSSLTSRVPAEGWQLYGQLEHFRVSPEFETTPTLACACPIERPATEAQPSPGQPESSAAESSQVKVPKLLKTYLAIGARIAAPPAWDREFGTIDFLTLLDLKLLSHAARSRFLAPLTQ
jgi:putative hemolysin